MNLRILEFVGEARKIVEAGEEALRALARGDEQWACNRVSLTHYAMSDLREDYNGILEEFRARGLEPGGAFGSNLPDRPIG